MLATEITACRSCHSTRLESVLNLGELCVSDFIRPGQSEDKAPLELVVCLDCSLVQLRHTVDRDRLYLGRYWYRSGVNPSMLASLKDVVDDVVARLPFPAKNGTAVLDIGANDGSLLRMFPGHWQRDGFEPSDLQDVAETGNNTIHRTYFPPSFPVLHKYDIITSIAMFYSVADPDAFVAGIKDWLHPDGIWVCQFQDLPGMLATNGLDNICHEHTAYWGIEAFNHLLARHDLIVRDATHNATNGGSVRYIVGHSPVGLLPGLASGQSFYSAVQLRAFGHKAAALRTATRILLRRLKAQGATIYGMGASTKFNTLAQYYGLGPDIITAIGERSPEKWGLQTVGTHVPIVSEAEVLAAKPDYLWIGPWHFFDNFRERYTAFDGKWIVPLPELRIVPASVNPTAIPVSQYEFVTQKGYEKDSDVPAEKDGAKPANIPESQQDSGDYGAQDGQKDYPPQVANPVFRMEGASWAVLNVVTPTTNSHDNPPTHKITY